MSDPVLELLTKQGISYRSSGKDYLIACLNPDHDDKNPSLRIDKVTGTMHCFGCGFKHNLFKHFGILTNLTSIKVAKLKEKIRELKINFEGQPLPEGATPYTQKFRGISTKTLKDFEAFTTHMVEKLQDRLVFPIYDVRDKVAVYAARHTLSNGNPRYIYYPESTSLPIYPVKYKEGPYSTAILVEGMFDMLNMHDKGCYNVTCVFGTNTLHKDLAIKLLPLKTQGITKIFILFDGDEAGRKAAGILKPLIEEQQFVVEIINLPDDMDPGDMDQEYVDSIREYVQA